MATEGTEREAIQGIDRATFDTLSDINMRKYLYEKYATMYATRSFVISAIPVVVSSLSFLLELFVSSGGITIGINTIILSVCLFVLRGMQYDVRRDNLLRLLSDLVALHNRLKFLDYDYHYKKKSEDETREELERLSVEVAQISAEDNKYIFRLKEAWLIKFQEMGEKKASQELGYSDGTQTESKGGVISNG